MEIDIIQIFRAGHLARIVLALGSALGQVIPVFRSARRTLGLSGDCWLLEAVCANSLCLGFPASDCLVLGLLVGGIGFAVFEVGRSILGFNCPVGVDFGRVSHQV